MIAASLCFVIVTAPHAGSVDQADVACNEPALPDSFLASAGHVLFRVSVTGADQAPMPGLAGEDFQIRENRELQKISVFSHDEPVTVGLLVDTGSRMAPFHAAIASSSLAFATSSRVENEFFVLAFNDRVNDVMSADVPFTHDAATVREVVRAAPAGERSALYDAVDHGLDYAARGRLEQRVLVVISGGGDTASQTALVSLIERATTSPTVIYTIEAGRSRTTAGGPDALTRLASLTGGQAFVAEHPRDISSMLDWIARDIRGSYTIGYVPESGDGLKFRTLNITLPGVTGAHLRYRSGYAGGCTPPLSDTPRR